MLLPPSPRVWGKMVEALADVGYDSNTLVSMPYDWRLAMPLLEVGERRAERITSSAGRGREG